MLKVFISYRRSDSQTITKRLYEQLIKELGEGAVFLDLYSIHQGDNFPQVLEEAINQCEVLLAIIGPGWLGAANQFGRRLDNEKDHLRIEIENGLRANITVIPVLVDGARMPRQAELPPTLSELALHENAVIRSDGNCDEDIEKLIVNLKKSPGEIYSLTTRPDLDENLLIRLIGVISPRLHLKLVNWGLARRPSEFAAVHSYLKYFVEYMAELNEVKQYIPIGGTEAEAIAHRDSDYALRPSRTETLKSIHRTVRLLSGISAGGDQVTAQLANLTRPSRVIRDVARFLRRKDEPIILLGDPGSGKSTTLREVGSKIAQAGLKKARPPVVVYVRLGQYREVRGDRPEEVWPLIRNAIVASHAGLRSLLHPLSKEGRLVILFDGMDEMERRLYGERVTKLSDFASNNQGTIKTLFACRTNDFSPKFIHRQLILLEFDRQQVFKYLQHNIRQWPLVIDGEIFEADRLAHHLLSNGELRETARNPLTLYLLCLFLQSKKVWPRTRHELFDSYIQSLFQRLRDASGERLSVESFPALFDGWARVAARITIRHAGTSIELNSLREDGSDELISAVIDRGLQCGLLVIDESDERAIRFAHHRIQEYLTARFLDHHAAEYTGIDWKSLIDTPRWQEVLINLASVQQGRSEALRIVLGSMQSALDKEQSGITVDKADDGAIRWQWHVAEERLLAEKVMLASRVIRELGQNSAQLPPEFLDAFKASVKRLADLGRPTTQVRMLWAWANTANVCPFSALDTPLKSEIDWVREQALSVIAEASLTRTQVDADLRRELIIDLTTGRLLRRLKAYHKAIDKANDSSLYASLSWAAICRLMYVAGLIGIFWAFYYVALYFWPLHAGVETMLPGLTRAGKALTLLGISFSVVALSSPFWEKGLLRRTMYVCAAGCSILFLASRINSGDNILWVLFEGAIRTGMVLGGLALGMQLMFWLAFGLYMLIGLSRDGAERRRNAFQVAFGNSFFGADRRLIDALIKAGSVFVFVKFLDLLFGLIKTHVLKPVDEYTNNYFHSLSWPNFLFVVIIVVWLYSLISTVRGWWKHVNLYADGSWRAFRKHAKDDTLEKLKFLLPVLSLLCLSVPIDIFFFILKYFGMGEEKRDRLLPLIIVLTLAFILTLGLFKVTRRFLLLLWKALFNPFRRRRGLVTKVGDWVARIKSAEPDEQFQLLSETSHYTLSISSDEFLRVLETLERHINKEPAASQYWKTRHALEEIARQERLANIADLDSETTVKQRTGSPIEGGVAVQPEPINPPDNSSGEQPPSLMRWAISILLLAVVATALLNQYLKLQRTVYVANGLPVRVEAQIDGGKTFSVESETIRQLTVSEGVHNVTFRRADAESQQQEFKISSTGILDRFFDNKIYVVNLGGAAILRVVNGFVSYDDDWLPEKPSYFFGSDFAVFPAVDYIFKTAQSKTKGDLFEKSELRFSPDLPADIFLSLPTSYLDSEKLELAEKHLRNRPANTALLKAYKDFAIQQGELTRCQQFLMSQIKPSSPPVEWYSQWQDLALRTGGPGSQTQVEEKLKEVLQEHPQKDSVLLCLKAQVQPSLTKALEYYAEALNIDKENALALFGESLAYESQRKFLIALMSCLRSRNNYQMLLLKEIAEYNSLGYALRIKPENYRSYEEAVIKVFDLYFALRQYEVAGEHLDATMDEFFYKRILDQPLPYPAYTRVLALKILLGKKDEAYKLYDDYRKASPDYAAQYAAYLHYFLEEFPEQLQAAREIPDAATSNLMQAFAQLELGNYADALELYKLPCPEARGLFYLMVSARLGINRQAQANQFRLEAEKQIRSTGLPVYLIVADMLASRTAPKISSLDDLNLPPVEKSILLVAMAQRFPELRKDALDMARKLAYTPLPPGHFIRKTIQDLTASRK